MARPRSISRLRAVALAAEAGFFLVLAEAALRTLPMRWLGKSIRRGGSSASEERLEALAWAVRAAARRLPLRLTCLRQAFAGAWMLQRRGLSPTLSYGVRSVDGRFEAHAWLDAGRRPMLGHQTAAAFTLLFRFPHEAE